MVLVPNNNTAGCQRVYGISFGNGDGAGALGLPYRDKACDLEQAADDAAATGNHKIAWWWRCHKPNLYKTFEGDTKEFKHLACWNSMVSMLEEPVANFNEPQPALVAADEDFDPNGLMAELTDEQYKQLKQEIEQTEEDHELVEQRQAQQQNLIESQAQEIERLKQEADELRKKQEAEEKLRESVRQRIQAKRKMEDEKGTD